MLKITADEIREFMKVATETNRDLSISIDVEGNVDVDYKIPTSLQYTSSTKPAYYNTGKNNGFKKNIRPKERNINEK